MQSSSYKSISYVLFIYWVVLVLWQNISGLDAKSTGDLIVKAGLFSYLFISYVLRSNFKLRNPVPLLLFLLTQMVSLYGESGITVSIIVSYSFTIIAVFCVYGLGYSFEISRKDYIWFLNSIIIVSLYCALYAFVFCSAQFANAFTITNAYGNELSSFFTSSHEYGLYMSAGIIACTICIEKEQKVKYKWFYIIGLLVFVPNLLLTFSRTTILGTAVFFFSFILFTKTNSLKKYMFLAFLTIIIVIALRPDIQNYLVNVVLKGNMMGSRELLYQLAIEMMNNANIFQKLFGYGIYYSRSVFERITTHGSVHNAYLQVVLYFGWIGLIWFVFAIVHQFVAVFKIRNKNMYWSSVNLSLLFWAISMMFTNTFILFNSAVDSFFMTIYSVIIPLGVCKSIQNNSFDE